MSPEEDRTRDAVDSEPKHYQLSYSGPLWKPVHLQKLQRHLQFRPQHVFSQRKVYISSAQQVLLGFKTSSDCDGDTDNNNSNSKNKLVSCWRFTPSQPTGHLKATKNKQKTKKRQRQYNNNDDDGDDGDNVNDDDDSNDDNNNNIDGLSDDNSIITTTQQQQQQQ